MLDRLAEIKGKDAGGQVAIDINVRGLLWMRVISGELGPDAGWCCRTSRRMESRQACHKEVIISCYDVCLACSHGVVRPKFMEEFFKDVEDMQMDLTNINLGTQKISELNQRAVLATSNAEEHAISNELTLVIEASNKLATHAKGLLEALKKESVERKKDKDTPVSEIRIRDNMCATLTKKFMDNMKDYQKAQQKYKNDMKNKVKRQVQIVKPDASEEEIDAVMRSPDPGSIYKTAILQGAADSIRDVYLNVQDKYQDVLRLEQSVAELHQMFLDLALLVEQQGEMLDQIEFQVRTAANYVEQGNQEVVKALKSQKSARKKKCCLLFVGLAIILIIVLVAAFK